MVHYDPRGFTVAFPETTWKHAEPHLSQVGSSLTDAFRVLTDPDLILDNPDVSGLNRSAKERFVRFEAKIQQHVIVPVRILDADQKHPGYGTLKAGTRLAVTIYASTSVPTAAVIWRK